MAKKTYAEKLKDPRWQKKRLEVLNDAEFQCELCGDTESTLRVHHKQYIKGHDVWEYERQQLACLCESCHENQHDLDVRFQNLLSRIPLDGPGSKDEVYYLLAGFLGLEIKMDYLYEQVLYKCGDDASDYWRTLR
jgi:hypothetical protein